MKNDLLNKISKTIEENLSNEKFGVSELAQELGMSRSNLLRKVKQHSSLSVSQLIRETRLQHAMQLLRQTSMTVSEVSYRVGFSSVSYFIKCFGDHYGYPPGEVGKQTLEESVQDQSEPNILSHRLVAIMFTDIEGYTALMQKDESNAITLRNRHREVFDTFTKKYSGRILQYYGDGTLSTFDSAIDAVRCAIQMQLAFQQEPQIPVRIGIHSGDIIFSEEDIIGDGVNVASRVESLATAGSVFISGKVYDEVKNQPDIQVTPMGKFELKNVDLPVDVYAISNPGLAIPASDELQGKARSFSDKTVSNKPGLGSNSGIRIAVAAAVVILAVLLFYNLNKPGAVDESNEIGQFPNEEIVKKSIAVLPFRNDSNDSSNIYIINGLMESILNNLQKIEDLRVISRTSVEKYRHEAKTIPEISKELNARYFVEGSGQKIGDQILLNVQLIEAPGDQHLWGEQYSRNTQDIFQLQMDVAKSIAAEIEVIVTPEEQERIEKVPTDNLEAYDYFLKGLEQFYSNSREGLLAAIDNFEKAIELDPEFARAYADIAISYYYLDVFQAEKQHKEQINTYADKALFYDAQLPQGMVAKALFYMNSGEYELALPHLEKALEYNPNSAMVIHLLSDFYSLYSPDTRKYLEYAIKGTQLEIAADDSTTASINYLHLSNALIQSGFVEEAHKYISLSLDYNPNNVFSRQLNAYITLAQNQDMQQAKDLLIHTLSIDSTRLDVVQEIARMCFFMRDYQEALDYYTWYLDIKESLNLGIFPAEDLKIAFTFSRFGMEEKASKYLENYRQYVENDKSLYQHLLLAGYYCYLENTTKAIEHLRLFSQEDDYFYWIVLFLEADPTLDAIKDHPEFGKIMAEIKKKFWKRHESLKESLEQEGLL